jgi:hypothetical protein
MRFNQHLKTLFAAAALATIAACAPMSQGRSATEVSVGWDSGPLDRAYAGEHADMVARHGRENAAPQPDESQFARDHRQASESAELDHRYAQGKTSHSDTLPPQ